MARRTISEALREDWKQHFADYLKTKRKRTGTTQVQLARHLGVQQSLISMIERGGYHIPREMAADIGEVFDEPQTAMAAAGYIPFVGWCPR